MSNSATAPKAHAEPEWRQRARDLRATGLTHSIIAERLSLSIKTVANFFSMDRGVTIDFGKYGDSINEESLIETHVTRPIRQIIKQKSIMPAARRFANGEITRAELMLAIAA